MIVHCDPSNEWEELRIDVVNVLFLSKLDLTNVPTVRYSFLVDYVSSEKHISL